MNRVRVPMRRWSSVRGKSVEGAELQSSAVDSRILSSSLLRIAKEAPGLSFLIVPISGCDLAGVRQAIDEAVKGGFHIRLSLAADRATLDQIETAAFNNNRVGFMLDEVDVEVRLAELVSDRIEAVRFAPVFVAATAAQLRLRCAMEAMLTLASDMGLVTFGSSELASYAKLECGRDFDYVPALQSRVTARRRVYRPAVSTSLLKASATR